MPSNTKTGVMRSGSVHVVELNVSPDEQFLHSTGRKVNEKARDANRVTRKNSRGTVYCFGKTRRCLQTPQAKLLYTKQEEK